MVVPVLQVAQNRAKKECNELSNEETRLRRDLQAQTANCARLASDNQVNAASLKSVEQSLAAAKAENGRLSRCVDSTAAKLRLAEEKRTALEQSHAELRQVSGRPVCDTLHIGHLKTMWMEQPSILQVKVKKDSKSHEEILALHAGIKSP